VTTSFCTKTKVERKKLKCGKLGHVNWYKCPGGEMSIKGYESKAINVSLVMGGDDIFQKSRIVSSWNFCAAMEKDEYC